MRQTRPRPAGDRTLTRLLHPFSWSARGATGIIGIPSAIISVVAWRQNAGDPAACRKRTTTGWIVYAVNFVVALPLLIWFYVWALSNQ